tara:strand:+ start:915 stop:1601 length:687 start_codon:yes stop_codon:yes gene_type:complete
MHVALIDHMGTDLTVVNSARVSFDKESTWRSTLPAGKVSGVLLGKDERLIKYLADHDHFTPFTHCTITMREEVPLFVARQRFKHTIGFSYNEVSRRYVDEPPKFYRPREWRGRADDKKQGSSTTVINIEKPDDTFLNEYELALKACEWAYIHLLELGVCPEQARMVLPQSMYTSYYVTGSLYAWARAYNLRSDPNAQQEIQELAKNWDRICKYLFPISWKALTKCSNG